MTTAELLATARIFLDDFIDPTQYLWSDAELTTYIQDAEQEAAERAHLLSFEADATYGTIAVVAATSTYAVDPLIYKINKVWLIDSSVPLTRTSGNEKDYYSTVWESETGDPFEYIFEGKNIRLYPTPTANTTMYLSGNRLPVTPIGTSPEIGPEYHRRMLDWVYRLAYMKRDKSTYEPQLAMNYEKLFSDSFGPKIDYATLTRQRKRTTTKMKDVYGD
jgi:hypothetical protein